MLRSSHNGLKESIKVTDIVPGSTEFPPITNYSSYWIWCRSKKWVVC